MTRFYEAKQAVRMPKHAQQQSGFTIVELIIIITVIAILVSIVFVSYTTVTDNAKKEAAKGDAETVASMLNKYKTQNGMYPASLSSLTNMPATKSTFTYTYNAGAGTYCVTSVLGNQSVYIASGSIVPQDGTCP